MNANCITCSWNITHTLSSFALTLHHHHVLECSQQVPSTDGRKEILQIITKKQKLANDVDLDKIAEITHGYVGADLAAVAMKAATSCIRRSAIGLVDMKEEDIPAEFLESLAVRMSDFMQAVKETGSSTIRDVTVSKPNVSFKDIGGLENVKKELKEMINFPSKYEELFRDIGVRPPTGSLLLRTSRMRKEHFLPRQWQPNVTRILSRLKKDLNS